MIDHSLFLNLIKEIVKIPHDENTNNAFEDLLKVYSDKLYNRNIPEIPIHEGPKKIISKDLFIHGSFLLDFYNYTLKALPTRGHIILQKLLEKSITTILDIQIMMNLDRVDSCFILLRNLYETSIIGSFLCLNTDLIDGYKQHTVKDLVKSFEIQNQLIPKNIKEDYEKLKSDGKLKGNYSWAYPVIDSKNIILKDIAEIVNKSLGTEKDYSSLYNICNQFIHSSSFSIFAVESITPFMLQDYFITNGCRIASEFLYEYFKTLNIDEIYLDIFEKINFNLFKKYNENLFM